MTELVSVLIPVLNDARALPDAVASIIEQRVDAPLEVLVVVGPSQDGSLAVAQELAAQLDQVRVIENPSGKTPDAMNRGIAESAGEVVVRVDARSVLPADYLQNALETMRETNAGNVGAVQVPVGDTPTQRAIAAAMTSRAGSGGAAYRHGSKRKRVGTAYLGVFKRAALEDVGGYDVKFHRNQDAELNARLNAAGHLVWLDPRLRVEYRPRASLRTLASQYRQYGWWRQRTMHKNRGSLELRQLAAPAVVLAVIASVVAAALGWWWALLVPCAYLAALVGAALLHRGLSLRERGVMVGALATMHFSWGTSFIASFIASRLHLGKE